MHKHLIFLILTLWSIQANAQLFVDSCFTSTTPSTSFASSADLHSYDSDLLEWNGTNWVGGWLTANITIPPINNVCRAIWIGSASVWTTGGEGFAIRLVNPLVAGQMYSIDFTYVSHGVGNAANFSPIVSSNLGTIMGTATNIGTLPPAGVLWTNNTLTFTATAAQNGHDWIIIHNGPTGSSGLVLAFCSSLIDLGPDTTLCGAANITLDATTGSATYLWQDGSTNPTFTATSSGLYWVEVDVNGCLSRDSININTLTVPSVNLGPDTTICIGDTLLLDASQSDVSYEWQDSSFDSTLQAFLAGQYWVVVSNICGFDRDTMNLSLEPFPTVNLGNDTSICLGTSLPLDASFTGATYIWSDALTTPIRSVSTADTFWVDVMNQCATVRDSIITGLDSVIEVDLGPDTILCTGDTLFLDASVPGGSYEWQDASSDSMYMVTGPGTYFVITSQKCGFSRDTIIVAYEAYPTVNLGNDTSICKGTALPMDVTFPGATYIWSDGLTTAIRTLAVADTFWVDVINGCSTTRDSIIIGQDTLTPVDLGADQTLCVGDSTTLVATTPGGSYEWQDASSDSTYLVTGPGIYSVVVSQKCGFARDTAQVNYLNPPNVNLGPDTALCIGQTMSIFSGHPNLINIWQDSSTSSEFQVTSDGLYFVNVSNGVCSAVDSIVIFRDTIPSVDLGVDTTLCDQNVYILNATSLTGSNVSYSWQDGSQFANYPVVNAGIYSVVLSNNCGTFTDAVNISTAETPDIELGPDTLICGNGNEFVVLDITWPQATYEWNNGSTEPVRIIEESGRYWVSIENVCGRDWEDRTFTFELNPKAEIGEDTTICVDDFPFLLEVEKSTGDYQWQDGSSGESYEVTGPGAYSVQTENLCGLAQDNVIIEDRACRCHLHIPTGFTPNGDNVNDLYRIGYQCNFVDYSIEIYNRWGQRVFSSDNPDDFWDGYHAGKASSEGVYTWVVRYSYLDRGDIVPNTEAGTVTLIR